MKHNKNKKTKRYANDAQTERRLAVDFIKQAVKDLRKEAEAISVRQHEGAKEERLPGANLEDPTTAVIKVCQASVLQEIANSIWRGFHLKEEERQR